MDISMSEMLAEYAVSSHLKSKYIPRYKWDEQYLNNIDKELDYMDRKILEKDLNYNNEIYETDIIKSVCVRSRCHRFRINKSKEKIWGVWLIITDNDGYNNPEDINRELLESNISIEIGGSPIISGLNIMYNLLFASFLGKKIIYEDNKIFVPIIALDLMYPNKFPVYMLEFHDFNIAISGTKDPRYNFELKYNWCRSKNKKKLGKLGLLNILQVFSNQESEFYNKIRLNTNHPTQLLLFEISNDQGYNDSILHEINLKLNGQSPIVFRSDMGEIIKFNILGKVIYAISLCSKFKYQEDLKKLFFRDPNDNNELTEGINFSRIDNAVVDFVFDIRVRKQICISSINTNQLKLINGMGGLSFC